jgi:NhaA family Na+:H+ antiporter
VRERRPYRSFPSSRPFRPALAFAVDHSLALPFSAIIALAWANLAPSSYSRVAHTLEFPVNDVAMALFFGLAAKEVVEATAPGGALHTWRRAALPVIAAVGGMGAPALLYVACAYLFAQPHLVRGWAIPCATDIAFSYLVVKAIFRRHPAIPFLLLLAVADDALGLIVLVMFYPTRELHLVAGALLMAAAIAIGVGLRRSGTRSFWPYVAVAGSVSWTAFFVGGLHPALALVPVVGLMPHAARDPGLFVAAPPGARDTLSQFEHWLKLPVQAVLFLFGLVNAGVPLRMFGDATWAVLLSIIAGKPIGIALAVAIAVTAGLRLPPRFGWRDVVVVGCAAGIGFTVALFFATAAFPAGPVLDQAKLGALLSVSAAVVALAAAAALRVGRYATVSPAAEDL